MKKLFLAIALTTAASFPVSAGMQHEHSSMTKAESGQSPLITVDGFDITFDIMTHKDYQKMMNGMKMEPMNAEKGTTHHIAVTIRKEGIKVEDAAVSLTVISPDKKEEPHSLTYNPDMMSQYVGHFNMPKKGKYQLLITFETGKEKHQGTVNYEVK